GARGEIAKVEKAYLEKRFEKMKTKRMRKKSRIPKVTAVINRRSFNDQSGAKGSYESIFSSIRANWSSNSAISARRFAMLSAASGLGSKRSIASSSALSLPSLLRMLSASRRHLFNSRLLTLTLESPPKKWGGLMVFENKMQQRRGGFSPPISVIKAMGRG